MRLLLLTALFCTACACKPVAGPGGQPATASPTAAGTVQMETYQRRIAQAGEVLVPPVLIRLSGTLGQRNGCLVLTDSAGDHALVFEAGKAAFDPSTGVLTAGGARIAIGQPISVGGPFNQPDANFDPAGVKKRCGVEAVWLVTGTDVKSLP